MAIWLETRKIGSASNTLQICLLRLIYSRNSVIDKCLTTRDHCAAMIRDLVFQKRLNDLLLQQLRQLKPITDKLNNEIL